MTELQQWALSFGILAIMGAIIIWDARVTRKQQQDRDKEE